MKHPLRNLFLLIVLAAFIFAVRVMIHKKRAAPVSQEVLVTVKKGDVFVKAAETGSLEPTNIVEIKSEQSGEVKKILVEDGDRISAGQPLATIEQESNQARKVAEARAAIEEEGLNLEDAKRESDRMEELFKKGFVSRKEVENAEKNHENAKIRHKLAKRKLLLTLGGNKALFERYLSQGSSSSELEEFTIYSPLSGSVLEVTVSVGEIVSSGTSTVTGGTALMRVADLSNMWVKTKINEVNIGQIATGQPVEIRLDAIAEKIYEGRVSKVSAKGEKVNDVVTYEVTITLQNADARLKPSMTANVDIITGVARDVLYLPLTALTEGSKKTTVNIKGAEGVILNKVISLGLRNENVAVITEGLKEGDQVILPKKAS